MVTTKTPVREMTKDDISKQINYYNNRISWIKTNMKRYTGSISDGFFKTMERELKTAMNRKTELVDELAIRE